MRRNGFARSGEAENIGFSAKQLSEVAQRRTHSELIVISPHAHALNIQGTRPHHFLDALQKSGSRKVNQISFSDKMYVFFPQEKKKTTEPGDQHYQRHESWGFRYIKYVEKVCYGRRFCTPECLMSLRRYSIKMRYCYARFVVSGKGYYSGITGALLAPILSCMNSEHAPRRY